MKRNKFGRKTSDNYQVSVYDTGRSEFNVHPISGKLAWPLMARDMRIGHQSMLSKLAAAIGSWFHDDHNSTRMTLEINKEDWRN